MIGADDAGSTRVSDLGEDALIARFVESIGSPPRGEVWTGDDAAFFPAAASTVVMTTDVMVQGVDFDLAYCTGADVGWKLVAANASDVAAMGATPRQAVATLTLPSDTPVAFVDDFLHGALEAARRWGISLVGGDLSSGPSIAVSLTLLGVPAGEPFLRSGARVGDAICVTGTVGGAGGGLVALRSGLVERTAIDEEIASATGADALVVLAVRHLRPQARVEEAALLAGRGVTAAIDVSDGLARDLERLLRASQSGCDVDPDAIPVHPELRFLADRTDAPLDPLELALTGGEDFELIVTMDAGLVEDAQAALDETGIGLAQIGTVTEGSARIAAEPIRRWSEVGWDHLRTP